MVLALYDAVTNGIKDFRGVVSRDPSRPFQNAAARSRGQAAPRSNPEPRASFAKRSECSEDCEERGLTPASTAALTPSTKAALSSRPARDPNDDKRRRVTLTPALFRKRARGRAAAFMRAVENHAGCRPNPFSRLREKVARSAG
jgi:hypothetical protein